MGAGREPGTAQLVLAMPAWRHARAFREHHDPEALSETLGTARGKLAQGRAPAAAPQVMLPQEIEEAHIIKQWLKSKRGGEKVEIFVPREGQP